MEVVTVVGARPQFIKAAALSRAIRDFDDSACFSERIVHTGQHYDDAMSDVFFRELGIPTPWKNLQVGSGTHAHQTADIMTRLEDCLTASPCDMLAVFGDTNSTVAAALVAAKMHIPVAHIEAGLRSFNRRMPEEINRVVTDHISTLHFCPSTEAEANLRNEGISNNVFVCGDIMRDALQLALSPNRNTVTSNPDPSLQRFDTFALATVHRAENTDNPDRLCAIMDALDNIGIPVILPLHPRTKQRLSHINFQNDMVHIVSPLSYRQLVLIQKQASLVLTDSGGIQKEAYWLGVPCITMRDETEWKELVSAGVNVVTGADRDAIIAAARTFLDAGSSHVSCRDLYGKPGASTRIISEIANWLAKNRN